MSSVVAKSNTFEPELLLRPDDPDAMTSDREIQARPYRLGEMKLGFGEREKRTTGDFLEREREKANVGNKVGKGRVFDHTNNVKRNVGAIVRG